MINELSEKKLHELKNKNFFDEININRGIEKEFFRVDQNGHISKRPHPKELGSALTNKYITTDFAEAQLELVTPVFKNIDDLHNFLHKLHEFVAHNIHKDEMLWPFSMPPHIKDESEINLGYYHQSNIGLLKHVYRRGLKVRYGSTMQCVSGMHYNFSVDELSLNKLVGGASQDNYNKAYLGLIRNFKRLFWFILCEFGQTNIVDKSFIKNRAHNLNKLNEKDFFLKNATSLRMSEIGYVSEAQKNLNVKYNSIEEFLLKIRDAIKIPYTEFKQKGLLDENDNYHQISDGVIQIENEYYDSIRPKRASEIGLRPYEQIKKFGIEYLEVRGIDIDSNEVTGISKNHIMFLDLILIYCLVSESPKITDEEKLRIDRNDLEAVYAGRDENTILTFGSEQKTIRDAKRHIYRDLLTLAEYFKDNKKFIDSISYVKKYSKADLPQTSFHEDGIKKAKKVTKFLREHENNKFDNIKYETEMSLSRLKNINENTSEEMNNFVKNYNEGI
tara:strand:+ start:6904 stop:8409 length:1506 start_codon:yes stop_codon:yes gene_type:complete